ncbi:GNAT family N-acetyltransferase [Rhodosalinus sp. K401]|uniref:GNAT family N-acetyltransferase n=1 Tax=Rhodosalinus sp. K401 TaxID=3239195 RepID=UPI003526BE75
MTRTGKTAPRRDDPPAPATGKTPAAPAAMSDLRGAGPDLRARALRLNRMHEAETSPLRAEDLEAMCAAAFAAPAFGDGTGFLIAFDEGAAYDSPNFRWFKARYPAFVYVDRVIVDPAARGRGLARRLYAALYDATRASGRSLIACEVNVAPPNPASLAFHAREGFDAVGEGAFLPGKRVAYMLRRLP